MGQTEQESGRPATKAWLRRELREGRRAARPVVLFGLAGTALAIGQAWCAALRAGGRTGRRQCGY